MVFICCRTRLAACEMSHILDFVSLSLFVIICFVSLSLIFWGNGIYLYRILLLVGSRYKELGMELKL